MDLLKRFVKEEDGLGTVEVVMLVLILVGLALVFKKGIGEVVDGLVDKIKSETKTN